MVCSACGFENQPGMRYCGMCGTPLPHRPLTTPGAQSTLNLTRIPVESTTGSQEQGTSSVVTRAGVLESSSGNGSSGTAEMGNVGPVADSASIANEPPPKDLVPDVSLDEYVQNFRYQPPKDSSELTMRGDAAPAEEIETSARIPDAAAPENSTPERVEPTSVLGLEKPAAEKPVIEGYRTVGRPASPREINPPSNVAKPVVATDSVVTRLGLDPAGPAEEPVRPRFLDISGPEKEKRPVPAGSGTSTIVGPSFLGLSDAPQITADPLDLEAEEDSNTSHWRGWMAAGIVVVFAVLGVVQWRAQTYQTGHGPIQVIRAKWQEWRHGSQPQQSEATPPAANTAPDANSAAQQVQPQPETSGDAQTAETNAPATNQSAANNAPATTAQPPAVPAGTSPTAQAPVTNGQPSKQSAPATETAGKNQAPVNPAPENPGAVNPASAKAAPADTAKAARKPAEQPTPPKPSALGAEEMSKAKNASDAAASAAWLWKATAKGNPDAPVQLADMYIRGNGVPKSCEQAMVLLKTAAAKDNAVARNKLGSMYATGNCVQRNRVEAYRWMSSALAANPDSQWAQQNRDQLWQQMTPDEQAAAQRYR